MLISCLPTFRLRRIFTPYRGASLGSSALLSFRLSCWRQRRRSDKFIRPDPKTIGGDGTRNGAQTDHLVSSRLPGVPHQCAPHCGAVGGGGPAGGPPPPPPGPP